MVGLGEEVHILPFLYQDSHLKITFVVNTHLLLGHGHDEVLVLSLGHLQGHAFLGASDESLAYLLADTVQVLVADDLARLVALDAGILEQVIGAEAPLVGKLHHGIEFF